MRLRTAPDLPLDLRAEATVGVDRLEITNGELMQEGNRLAVTGTIGFSPPTIDTIATGTVAEYESIWHAFDLPARWIPRGSSALETRITGPLANPTIGTDVNGTLGVGAMDPVPVSGHVTYHAPQLGITALNIETPAGLVTGGGSIDLSTSDRAYRADLAVSLSDAERLAPVFAPTEWPLSGAVVGRATFEGRVSDLIASDFDAFVERIDGAFHGIPLRLDQPARIQRAGEVVRVEQLVLHTRDTIVTLDGALGPGTSGLSLSADAHLADLDPLLAHLGLGPAEGQEGPPDPSEQGPHFGGIVHVSARAQGSIRRPLVEGRISGDRLAVAWPGVPTTDDIAVDVTLQDGMFYLANLSGTWQGAALSARANLPFRLVEPWLPSAWHGAVSSPPAPAYIGVEVQGVTPEALAPFVSPDVLAGIGGRVSARVNVVADRLAADAWRGDVIFDEAELSFAQIPIHQREPTRLLIESGRLRVDSWLWEGPGTTITAFGGLSWHGGEPRLDAAVDADVNLRMASVFVRPSATGGHGNVSVSLAGPIGAPIVEGRVLLSDAEFRMPDPRIAVTEVSGAILLTGDRISLEQVHGSVNGGTLTIGGSAQLHNWHLDTVKVPIDIQNAAIEFPDGFRSEIAADLQLVKTTEDESPELAGTVTVLRGSYREQLGLASRLFAGNRPTVTFTERREEGSFDLLRMNISVTSLEDVEVDTNYGRAEAGAALRLQGTVGEPSLTGRITLREGGTVFLGGTTYHIESGSIDFRGRQGFRPELDIVARTQVGNYSIRLEIGGTTDRIRAQLSSDPPLDQSNIVSLLVTGRTIAEGGLTTEVVGEQVLGFLSGDILNYAGRTLGLDAVRIDRGFALDDLRFDPTVIANETDPASRLTITKNLTPEIEVILSQNLSGSGDLTWVLTWRPRRTIAFRVLSLDTSERTYEFRQELTFGGSAPASLRRRPPGPRILDVTFSGTGFDPAAVRKKLKLEPGDRFDFYDWQDDRERLLDYFHDQGWFEATVAARRRDTTEENNEPAVVLTYEIQPGARTELVIEGASLPSETLTLMRTEWTRAVFDDFLAEDLTRIARRALAREGYLRADVKTTIEVTGTPPSQVKRSRVVIAPGSRTNERTIVWTGNEAIDAKQLTAELERLGLVDQAWENPAAIEPVIRELYATEGYLSARAVSGVAEFEGDRARLPVRIVEGPQARLATVIYQGARAFPASRFAQVTRLTPGEPLRPADLDRARRAIERLYFRNGFNEARVDVKATSRPDGQVDIVVTIEEGAQQVLTRIEVAGAPNTNRNLVTNALKLETDQPLSTDAFYEARRRLYEIGAFRQVDVQVQPLGEPAPASTEGIVQQPVAARVELEEWPLWRFRYGLQINDVPEFQPLTGRDVGPGVSTDIERHNLFGRAVTVGTALRYERRRQAVRGYLSTPRFFGMPVTTTFFTQEEWEQQGDTDSRILRISLDQLYRVQQTTQLHYGYFYRRTFAATTVDIIGQPIRTEAIINYSGLYSAVSLDRRNDPFDASRGWFHSSSLEFAAKLFGSDARFVKWVTQQSYYWPVGRRLVLAWNGRLGLADGFGQELIDNERFFAGGGSSVRGYREDSLSPTIAGIRTGGEALLILNQEARFPIWKRFRGVAFLDAGNAFTEPTRIDFGELEIGAGLGLRLMTPVGLLRFDFGVPVTRGGLGSSRLHFSFGQVF